MSPSPSWMLFMAVFVTPTHHNSIGEKDIRYEKMIACTHCSGKGFVSLLYYCILL